MPEKLNHIEKIPFWLRPLKEEDKPHYSDLDKHIISWTIALEGSLDINRDKNHYKAIIMVANTDFELLANFAKILKLGKIHPKKPHMEGHSPQKILQVVRFPELLYILQQLKGYMPCEKYQKLRSLVAEFCMLRIEAHKKGTRAVPYSLREHEIFKEVKKLNARGLKPS